MLAVTLTLFTISLHAQSLPLQVSRELAVTVPGFARVPVESVRHAVASDGKDFLLVWYGNGGYALRAARIQGDGTLLDPGGVEVLRGSGLEPELIWGGEHYFLFTYESGRVVLRRISRNAELIDREPIVVTAVGDPVRPVIAAASNGEGAILVVGGASLQAVRIGRKGEIGSRFTIPRGAESAPLPFAVSSSRSSYDVTWFMKRVREPEHDLLSLAVTGEGAPAGSAALLYSTRGVPKELEAGSTGGRPVLVWMESGAIKARVPSPFGSTVFDVPSGRASDLSLATNESQGALLTWTEALDRGAEQLVRVSLTSGGGAVVDASGTYLWAESAGSDAGYLIVHSERFKLSASLITGSGTPRQLSPAGLFTTTAGSQSNPAVTRGEDGTAVVWSESDRKIMFGRVDSRGAVLDPMGIEVSPIEGGGFFPSVSFDGESYLVTWESYNRATSKTDIRGRLLNRQGVALGDGSFLVGGLASNPVAIWSGTKHLVFAELRSGEIGVVGVSRAGVVIDPTFRTVASPLERPLRLSVARGSDGVLLAWQEGFDYRVCHIICPGPVSKIRAARLTPEGVSLDPAGILVSRRAVSVDPVAIWNGSAFVVLWAHLGSSSRATVFAAVISPDGRVEQARPDENGREIVSTLNVSNRRTFAAAPDGSGGVFVVWTDRKAPASSDTDLFASRGGPDGTLVGDSVKLAASNDPEALPVASTLSAGKGIVFYVRPASEAEYGGASRIFGRVVASVPFRSRAVQK